MKKLIVPALALCASFSLTPAFGHFIWLSPKVDGNQSQVCVYFGEEADDDNSEYLSRVSSVSVSRITGTAAAEPVKLHRTSESISATADFSRPGLYVASHDLGVMERGGAAFRLKYYAKTGPQASSDVWQSTESKDDLRLDVVPSLVDGQVHLTVYFDQKPTGGIEIKAARPGADDFEGTTTANGTVTFATAKPGLYSIRARHVENEGGEVEGKAYSDTRHYCTVSLLVEAPKQSITDIRFQDLPEPVTSFGAAVTGDALYMYGGHSGSAHSYSQEEQSNKLTRLDLKSGKWGTVIEGPHLQGLALVTHGGKLYRIGGFTAMNAEGEEHELVSQNSVVCFDPAKGSWQEMPALPERRSSHDAAVVGDCIYVVGGWAMGEADTQWHSTAWKLDLKAKPLHWQPIAAPSFQRRAIAAAAHNGKLYVVGGMQEKGGPTTATAVYDPETDQWSEGPSLYVKEEPVAKDGEKPVRSMSSGAMAGFGASAFATGGQLYVTTVQGLLQKLSADGSQWEVVRENLSPRFFHRLLPVNDRLLVVVGGSNMSIGKFEAVELIDVTEGS